ncbi:MAG: hypothetical protein ACFHWX_09400 [Bacteroidota bacterium]
MSENSNKDRTLVIIIIVVVVIVGAAGGWYFLVYKPEQDAQEKARLELIAKQEAEKRAQEQAAQNKIRYDQLILDGDAAFNQENWEAARNAYSEASSLFPDEQYPKDQLAIVNTKLEALAKIAAGLVETVTDLTGRFYIIVSSSLDDDLAMDYANKLANEGNAVKIIDHKAKDHSFFGVSVADYPTWEDALAATNNGTYSSFGEVWVLKH